MIEEAGLFAPILGHGGDGNFHVFFILHPDDKLSWQKASVINDAMVDHALSVGGTCTGEHGIGLGKRDALLRENGAAAVEVMRSEEHTSAPVTNAHLVCRLLLEKKKKTRMQNQASRDKQRQT